LGGVLFDCGVQAVHLVDGSVGGVVLWFLYLFFDRGFDGVVELHVAVREELDFVVGYCVV